MRFFFHAIVVVLACGWLLGACAPKASAPAPAAGSLEDGPAPGAQEYRLGVGDELRIAVFGQPDLTGQFMVGTTGAISYPLLGEIPAADLTLAELTASIKTALEKGYVRQPTITLEIVKFRPFYILGEVQKPGTYPFTAGLTIMKAVATAGGFTYRANARHVLIRHANDTQERRYELTSATRVQPGDTVRIIERMF